MSAIPQDQMTVLVDAIADGVLLAVDELLNDAGLPSQLDDVAPVTGEEKSLWQGRPFLSVVTRYQITTERVRIVRGLLGKGP